jgi:hypothetical protein
MKRRDRSLEVDRAGEYREEGGRWTPTWVSFEVEGTPEECVQALRVRLRELSASLPVGETKLALKAKVSHPKRPTHRK